MPSFAVSHTFYLVALTFFLVLISTHLLDFHPLWLLGASLVFVRPSLFKRVDALLVLLLFGAIYATWYRLDARILHNFQLGQGLLAVTLYAAGAGLTHAWQHPKERVWSALLPFVPFISYALWLLGSYVTIPQPQPIDQWGMYVWYDNLYSLNRINEGRLISTIIAYYLTPAAILLPILLFFYRPLLDPMPRYGRYVAVALILLASLSALYLAAKMGRRTVLYSFVLVTGWLTLRYFWRMFRQASLRRRIVTVVLFLGALTLGAAALYAMLADTMLMERIATASIFHDRRYTLWLRGLEVMRNYPWGGGHGVYIDYNTALSHNTWIDIGKYFGVVPFGLSVAVFALHAYRLVRIWRRRDIPVWFKEILTALGIVFGVVLTVEPVFVSDKIFFALIFFYLGVLHSVATTGEETIGRWRNRQDSNLR